LRESDRHRAEAAADPTAAIPAVWNSMEKIQAWRSSAAFKELPLRDKYAKFRSFSVEGIVN